LQNIELDKLINIEKLLITYHVQNKYIMRKILIYTHGMKAALFCHLQQLHTFLNKF